MTTPKATCAGIALIAALCAGFTLGLTAPAWGDEDELPPLSGGFKMMQWGGTAYKRATVFRETRRLADQGNANAQHDLGIAYEFGVGVPQDGARAARWYSTGALDPASGTFRVSAWKH